MDTVFIVRLDTSTVKPFEHPSYQPLLEQRNRHSSGLFRPCLSGIFLLKPDLHQSILPVFRSSCLALWSIPDQFPRGFQPRHPAPNQ